MKYFDVFLFDFIKRVVKTHSVGVQYGMAEATEKILQLEVEALKYKQKLKSIEHQLTKCRKQRDNARKDLNRYKNLYEKQQTMPVIHSDALNVSWFSMAMVLFRIDLNSKS